MKKIINKEILPNGVVVLTMNNPEVNNNITWKAAEDLFLEIKSSRENLTNSLKMQKKIMKVFLFIVQMKILKMQLS